MSLSKRSGEQQQKHKAPQPNSMSTHFLELSSTLANTTNMSRRSMACGKSLKKIPKVISSLEKNIQTLKKYCTEMAREKPLKGSRKSSSKLPSHNDSKNAALERSSGSIDIDWVRNAYAASYGQATNNLVELYEFYKNHLEKSGLGNGLSFSQSNNSTSIVKLGCVSSICGKDDSKSSQSRQTPSLSKEDQQMQETSKVFRRTSERPPACMFVDDGRPHFSFNNPLEKVHGGFHNSSMDNQTTYRTKTISNQYYNGPSRKNDDMPLSKQQLSSSHDNPTCENKKQTRKKRDPGNMPLQQKILRIQTEADRELQRPKGKHQVRKYELNLVAELQGTQHNHELPKASISEVYHLPPRPKAQAVRQETTSVVVADKGCTKQEKISTTISTSLNSKAEMHLPRSSMPSGGPVPSLYNINSGAPPARPLQNWSRPSTGTPHVASGHNPPAAPKRFINDPPSKSTQKEEPSRKDDFDSWMIYEKNMLINKRKQQINGRLRQKQKIAETQPEELVMAPASLDEAIILQPISPIEGAGKDEGVAEPGLFDQALQLNKQKLPLSKHDLSLWENMNLVEEMHQKGELSHLKSNTNCKENILAPALELIKKKKSFKKSKFYVQDIPHPARKSSRQVQLIDIEGMSPQTLKVPEGPRKVKKEVSKDDSLLGCDISLGDRLTDPLLNEIQSIQFDL